MERGRNPGPGRAERFLAALARSRRPVGAADLAVVVAHADDETIGCGGQLGRLRGVTLVHVTDGAPPNGEDARAHGFGGPAEYAAARRAELAAALDLAGVPPARRLAFDVPDQEASLRLADLSRRLAVLYRERGIGLVLTHAYEGGHPDHDATAFAVHAASRLLGARGPAVIEFPLYNLAEGGWGTQRFVPCEGATETVVALTDRQRRLKRAMAAAHASQAAVLATFGDEIERFRPAPTYDFALLPNDGRLLYETYGWGMTGARWRSLAEGALRELGLEGPT